MEYSTVYIKKISKDFDKYTRDYTTSYLVAFSGV